MAAHLSVVRINVLFWLNASPRCSAGVVERDTGSATRSIIHLDGFMLEILCTFLASCSAGKATKIERRIVEQGMSVGCNADAAVVAILARYGDEAHQRLKITTQLIWLSKWCQRIRCAAATAVATARSTTMPVGVVRP